MSASQEEPELDLASLSSLKNQCVFEAICSNQMKYPWSDLSILLYFLSYTVLTIFFKDMNAFAQQGCIKLIKSDSKNIYNVTKDLYFK